MLSVLNIPGWHNSPELHWQSRWEAWLPGCRRLQQRDWVAVERASWVATLEAAVAEAAEPLVLLAHSLGVLTVAHWAQSTALAGRVLGAFLVTPPDVESRARCPECLRGFGPVPRRPLPFPSLVVASENDPYADQRRVEAFAGAWRSELIRAGRVGHINVDSGHGPWVQGELLFSNFLAQVSKTRVK